MSDLLNYMDDCWFMTFLLSFPIFITIWIFISGVFGIVYALANGVYKILCRSIRLVMVAFRGWPPEHVDADGDFRPRPKPVKEGTPP